MCSAFCNAHSSAGKAKTSSTASTGNPASDKASLLPVAKLRYEKQSAQGKGLTRILFLVLRLHIRNTLPPPIVFIWIRGTTIIYFPLVISYLLPYFDHFYPSIPRDQYTWWDIAQNLAHLFTNFFY